MSLETDLLLDRRRLKRRLFAWRTLAIVAIVAAVLAAVNKGAPWAGARQHIARVTISGFIGEDRKLHQAIDALAKDSSVPAVLVVINSPGGSVAGGESLNGVLTRVAAAKPLVTVMGGIAASAGYMAAVPAARIFAREGTLTGSIGVLLETGEVSGLLNKLGITSEAITSGPLKDQPSFFKPMSPEGRAVLHEMVMDMYDQFVGMVAAGRHMDVDSVRSVADGRAYTGRQALKLGLIDEIGGEPEARDWLAANKGVPRSMPIDDLKIGNFSERLMQASGAASLATGISRFLGLPVVSVDGAWAIWQPSRQ